jgi:hypothetical protein
VHSHPHEQIGLVLEGVQVLIVGGREHQLGVNEAYVVPGGVEHGGRGRPGRLPRAGRVRARARGLPVRRGAAAGAPSSTSGSV